ncbi:hypothetical protein [Pseudolysinimonas sp.]
MSTQARALEIATAAHEGQLDKAGQPYLAHPLRVRDRVAGESARIVATLHDVVEDSEWTLDDLAAEGFAPHVIAAVDALTKRPGEELADSMARVVGDALARAVKCADLADNADLARLAALDPVQRARLEQKYSRSAAYLGTDLEIVRESPARAALSREPADQLVDADAAVARILGPSGAERAPGDEDRLREFEERWLWARLARRLGDPDPYAV